MKPSANTLLLTGGLGLLATIAIVFAIPNITHYRSDGEEEAKVWFYDQNAQRLYPAPRRLISPDGDDDTRVRAVVIGFQGLGNDASQLKIAYLEKYSLEFKALLERAEAAHAAKLPFDEKIPSPSSAWSQENTMVKRPSETSWRKTSDPEARQIMEEWRNWRGPSGQPPIISVPSIR